MTQHLSTEERLAILENEVAELKRQRLMREEEDATLLARVDTFASDLHRVERAQLRGFDGIHEELRAHQEYVTERFAVVESGQDKLTERLDTVEDQLTSLTNIAVSHGEILQSLAIGQKQILEMLQGKQKTND